MSLLALGSILAVGSTAGPDGRSTGGNQVKFWLTGALVALGWLVVAQSGAARYLGNQVRGWTDRAMLTFLQLTSEFEAERGAR